MDPVERFKHRLNAVAIPILPLGLWALLWLSLQPGTLGNIFHPASLKEFANSTRAAFPYIAAFLAVLLMAGRYSQYRTGNRFFSSPLAFATVYGLVGVIASLRSPEWTTSLNWAFLYLTAPLILWAAMWGTDSLGQVLRLVRLNLAIVLIGCAAFFTIALFSLGLGEAIINPSALLQCEKDGSWFVVTSGMIRSTGVGRFAAVGAIIALGMLWRGNRWFWSFVLITSLVLLLSTAARTSMVGLAAALPLVLLLQLGKKTIIVGALAIAVLLPLFWATGIHETFLRKCILIGTDVSGISYLNINSPNPVEGQATPEPVPTPTDQPSIDSTPVPDSTPTLQPTSGSATPSAPDTPLPSSTPVVQPTSGSATPSAADTPILDSTPAIQPTLSSASPTENTPVPGSQTLVPTVQPTAQPTAVEDPTLVPTVEPTAQPTPVEDPTLVPTVPPTIPPQVVNSPSAEPEDESTLSIPTGFFTLTGRTKIWWAGWQFIKRSPLLGYGFHADRLVLGTHMHNAIFHALIQTGFIGLVPFLAALVFGWILVLRLIQNLNRLAAGHKNTVIVSIGILAFLSVRTLTESTGAFFGIDWLLLSPLLLYLRIVESDSSSGADEL